MSLADIIGWVSAIALASSYALTNIRSMRIANSLGCIGFITYGALLSLPSIILLNACLLLIHLCYLLAPRASEKVMTDHLRTVFILLGIFSIAFIAFTVVVGYSWQEMVGVISSLMFVFGWILPDEGKMRKVCAVALSLNIIYAALVASLQVIVTNSISLVINIRQLFVSANVREETKVTETDENIDAE